MPRVQPFYSEFFYSPLTEDVEELLARFQQTDSVRYGEFSAIWREMSFSDVFLGVTRVGELRRFCRITLATAMKYFLPPYNYQIRVGGLYLMFGFYHTQLARPPVQIRLCLRDYAQVQKFLKDSVEAGHQDVVYIYQKLVADKAIHYTAMPHFLTFQKQRKQKEEPVCAEFLGRTTAIQELLSGDSVEELTNIQSHYEKLKEATMEVRCKVTMSHRDLAARLKDSMSEFISWQEKTFSQDNKDNNSGDDAEEAAEAESSRSRARLVSSIKQKSYSNFQVASKSRRHRQVETVDSSSSGTEQVQEAALQRKRPPSLRARTWKSLRVMPEENKLQAWLLSAPEQREKVPVKRTNQLPPFKP
ncbi:snRNA-activating protein complex subunit 1-like [Micropterus dolomieu]|uniref:snRNA-activating protein complex subunit 1-like n=1 Tax=Micropterus dolomieu TaxID=147949 RepID=UPI001E8EDAD4|nr:snRNA-activating protein complex subunit 1-like [Micropterus dolomieu]